MWQWFLRKIFMAAAGPRDLSPEEKLAAEDDEEDDEEDEDDEDFVV